MTDPVAASEPRKGMPSPKLDRQAFADRYRSRFNDPAFDPLRAKIDEIVAVAWDAYQDERKAPVTEKAGSGFADPDYDLAVDWRAAHDAIEAARTRHADPSGPLRILLINGSSRSEHTCPGEMSKSFRLTLLAQEVFDSQPGFETTVLDLSRLASEFGREIHPCKACFSTAAALCHFPCSCYPNYSLGQVHDWMNDIYPMWVQAHGIFIVTPVNWYQVSSPIKLMMDRMVCCDGGNPDPSLTQGKDAKLAKQIELEGWDYPSPGRSVVLGRGPRRRRGGRERAALPLGLAAFHEDDPCGAGRRTGSLHRLLGALCDQPRRPGQGHGCPGRGSHRGPAVGAGRQRAARWVSGDNP